MNASRIRLSVGIGLMGAVVLMGRAAPAQSLEQQREWLKQQGESLNLIGEFATKLCMDVPLTGDETEIRLSGEANAELVGMLKKLANLGLGAAAEYESGRYEGVLQADLRKAIQDGNECRLQVMKDLKDKLLYPPPSSAVADAGTPSDRPLDAPALVPARRSPGADTSGWELLGAEDFTDTARDWPVGEWERSSSEGRLSQEAGVLRVDAVFKDGSMRKFNLPYPASLGIKLGMDVRFVPARPLSQIRRLRRPKSDDAPDLVGVFFERLGGTELQYHLSRNGSYALTRAFDDGPNDVLLDWVRSGVTTSEWNRLEVEVVESTVTLLLNGSVAAQYRDFDLRGGTVGYFVGAKVGSDVSVDFDNFELYRSHPRNR